MESDPSLKLFKPRKEPAKEKSPESPAPSKEQKLKLLDDLDNLIIQAESLIQQGKQAQESGDTEKAEEFKNQALSLISQAELIKNRFNLPDSSIEALKSKYLAFFNETFDKWNYNQETKDQFTNNFKPSFESPSSLNWPERKADTDSSKFGEFTLNPDTETINWETIPQDKIKTIKLPDKFNNKPLTEAAKYIIDTYSAKYLIPGIEYWKYILENPDQAPDSLKDGNYHFFFGSILRGSAGCWFVPVARWDGSGWHRRAGWLESGWASDCRVVLLEK